MSEKVYENVFRFSLYQGNSVICEKVFTADRFNPVSRYSVDIREIIPSIVTRLQRTLSQKFYETTFYHDKRDDDGLLYSEILYDFIGYKQNLINQMKAKYPETVFEKIPQWLDQFEGHIQGQTTHVMVGFNALGLNTVGGARFDHIRVDCPLNQERRHAQPSSLLLEGTDEQFPDDPSFLLRFRDGAQSIHKGIDSVNNDQFHAQVGVQSSLHLGSLTLAQQTGIDEHRHELVPNRALYHRCRHG